MVVVGFGAGDDAVGAISSEDDFCGVAGDEAAGTVSVEEGFVCVSRAGANSFGEGFDPVAGDDALACKVSSRDDFVGVLGAIGQAGAAVLAAAAVVVSATDAASAVSSTGRGAFSSWGAGDAAAGLVFPV